MSKKHHKKHRIVLQKIRMEAPPDYADAAPEASKPETLDNVRRILSSFFSWLEDEDYIVKSPVRRTRKVRAGKAVKETYSDESLEMMRDHCDNARDLLYRAKGGKRSINQWKKLTQKEPRTF